MKATRAFKSVNALVRRTTSKTFQAYWRELRRHEKALIKIYGDDKLHIHAPEEIGTVRRVHPDRHHIITFYRCSICMKDLTQKEVEKLSR